MILSIEEFLYKFIPCPTNISFSFNSPSSSFQLHLPTKTLGLISLSLSLRSNVANSRLDHLLIRKNNDYNNYWDIQDHKLSWYMINYWSFHFGWCGFIVIVQLFFFNFFMPLAIQRPLKSDEMTRSLIWEHNICYS